MAPPASPSASCSNAKASRWMPEVASRLHASAGTRRPSPHSVRRRVRRRVRRGLLEDAEVAEEPPQQNEDQHGAEAATAKLLRAVSGGDAAQQFAHRAPIAGVGSGAGKCTVRTRTCRALARGN